ncbi:hypothetical protein Pmani_009036 [Petrolisthes manimaculis]|uniref:Transgelin n=1 Tax=Petrolisthes manimaculis TaxID=1843537 RepID=A0AAE1Q4E2_9EUCA|nr:hypothetical protein Pmani_009036 [Petrolisthes manimaculis]
MNRATKSGIAAEAQSKIEAKFSEQQAGECLQWIAEVTGKDMDTTGSADNFYELLKNGMLLCEVINTLMPGQVKKIQTSTMAFKCMENINNFTEGAKKAGVPSQETFQTVDLWERQNLNSVVVCIQSLGRKGSQFGKPSIGPKESEKNVRQFSDEQRRAGDSVISLQYGSNKGANQAGMSFGNTRHM